MGSRLLRSFCAVKLPAQSSSGLEVRRLVRSLGFGPGLDSCAALVGILTARFPAPRNIQQLEASPGRVRNFRLPLIGLSSGEDVIGTLALAIQRMHGFNGSVCRGSGGLGEPSPARGAPIAGRPKAVSTWSHASGGAPKDSCSKSDAPPALPRMRPVRSHGPGMAHKHDFSLCAMSKWPG